MNMKEKLKHAVDTSDWGVVCEVYESMFGEEIHLPSGRPEYLDVDLIKRKAIEIVKECEAINMPHQETAIEAESEYREEPSVEEAVEEEEEDIVASTNAQITMPTDGSWQGQVKQSFISSDEFSLPEDEISGYSEGIKKHAKRKKHRRESYVPQLMNCPKCGVEFDYNKEYPAGTLDSSRGIKCNKCRLLS